MRYLRLEDVPDSIIHFRNRYEEKMGIKTLEVKPLKRINDIGFFLAKKSDNSKSLYFAYKPSKKVEHWVWCCPNKDHVRLLSQDLSDIWDKEHPDQNFDYFPSKNFSSLDEIRKEILSCLGSEFKLRILTNEETMIFLMAEKEERKNLFIAFKPSSRFYHWYLFSPSVEQIQILRADLKKLYSDVDSENIATRWK